MRPLTEEEQQSVFSKLAKYIGDNVTHLIEVRPYFGNIYIITLHLLFYFFDEKLCMKCALQLLDASRNEYY